MGNQRHEDGSPTPWTATTLESALDGKPDRRSIEYWRSRTNMPSPDNIRKLSIVASGGDHALRKTWYDSFMAARRVEKRRSEDVRQKGAAVGESVQAPAAPMRNRWRLAVAALVALLAVSGGIAFWFQWPWSGDGGQSVGNIRICDAPWFDSETKKCTKHVSVFVHGIEEVFLSFDFENVPDGAPFERWWIRNGERVAGRTSFNDVAWPGYTFWRPAGGLRIGEYVVRVVVDEKVFTQVFQVQHDGFHQDQ
ncbi:MAG: hypothetical protein F4103_11860 [Boseongicola sp. SB0673_bin_14]|nr:hypothetical protein [Boseongicola sp. SB0673_bin_14]